MQLRGARPTSTAPRTTRRSALAVNADGAANIARGRRDARRAHRRRLHRLRLRRHADRPPYVESDPTAPLGAYGRTKLAGEQAVAGDNPDHAIARTAWLFGAGGKNFPDTMLSARRASATRSASSTDQVGSPTWTGHLAPRAAGPRGERRRPASSTPPAAGRAPGTS